MRAKARRKKTVKILSGDRAQHWIFVGGALAAMLLILMRPSCLAHPTRDVSFAERYAGPTGLCKNHRAWRVSAGHQSTIQGAAMFVFLGGLLEGILSFLTDVWLLRKHRSINERPANSWKKDAADVAYLEWWLTLVVSGLAVLGFVFLFYFIGLPFGISFFIAVVPAALYGAYRWIKLLRA
jgi:hypothetical protein